MYFPIVIYKWNRYLFWQTQIEGVRNPHGLAEGWAWLARFLNALPANRSTAYALEAFLKVSPEPSTLLLVCYLVILSAVTKSTCLLLPDGRICIAQEIQVSVQEGAQCHFLQLSTCAQGKRGSKVE